MHVWPASSEFNQARPGRNLQQNTQQMLTWKSQPQSHHYWTELEFVGSNIRLFTEKPLAAD